MSGVTYTIDQCEEPLYTLLYNIGLAEISHEDYEVLAGSDAATVQSYLEAAASDPESYPWESVIYTLREAMGAAAPAEAGETAEGYAAEGEAPAAEEGEGYAYAEGGEGAEGYEYQYATEGGEGAEGYAAEEAVGDGGEEEVYEEGGLDAGEYGYGEEGEGEGAYAEEEGSGERELAPLPIIEEELPPEGSWACTRCTYLNKQAETTICGVCRVSRDCEDRGVGFVDKTPEGKLRLILDSKDVPNNKNLRGAFKVQKFNSGSVLSSKKDRVFELDFFTREFKNCDTSGKVSFALQSANLYRVERHLDNPRAVRLLFFKASHPIDLIFPSMSSRQRFMELAALQRRNPVVWAPSFCRQNCKEITVKIEGSTLNNNGADVKVEGNQTFTVSRMPYEVQHVWAGTINLQHRGLPLMSEKLEEFMPNDSDVYMIGLQDVPQTLMKQEASKITDFFTNFFGQNFYVLLNTAADTNVFAGIEGRKPLLSPCVIVIVVRRAVLGKIGNVDYVDLLEDGKKPGAPADSNGVFASFRIQDSTIGCLVMTITPNLPDVITRNAKIEKFLSKIKCGDPAVDISARFDYFFLMGALGYHTIPTDELHGQIGGQVILSDYQECTILQEMCLPDRVLFWHRPRSARATILQYTTAPHLGMPNIQGVFDVFVQRPYLYALSPEVPTIKIVVTSVSFNCDTLPNVKDAECVITSEAFEDMPLRVPLKLVSAKYGADTGLPTLSPVCPAYEFLRAQSVLFSLFGIAEGITKKKELIASAVIPLRDLLIPDEKLSHSAFVLRHSTVIGLLETTVMYKTRQ